MFLLEQVAHTSCRVSILGEAKNPEQLALAGPALQEVALHSCPG